MGNVKTVDGMDPLESAFGVGPFDPLNEMLEDPGLGLVCDLCGQKGLRYKYFYISTSTRRKFGLGSECVHTHAPELWLQLRSDIPGKGRRITKANVRRKQLFDEAQPLLDQYLELFNEVLKYNSRYKGLTVRKNGMYGPYLAPVFDGYEIEKLRKPDGYGTCTKWERMIEQLKRGITEVEAKPNWYEKNSLRPRGLSDEDWIRTMKEGIRSAFNRPGRPHLKSLHMDIAQALVGQGTYANDPDRWSMYALEQCLTALTSGE